MSICNLVPFMVLNYLLVFTENTQAQKCIYFKHKRTGLFIHESGWAKDSLQSGTRFYPVSNTKGQIWLPKYRSFLPENAGTALDIINAKFGETVKLWDKAHQGPNQLWYIGGDGLIRSVQNTNWCLTVESGGRQTVADCGGCSDAEKFKFTFHCDNTEEPSSWIYLGR